MIYTLLLKSSSAYSLVIAEVAETLNRIIDRLRARESRLVVLVQPMQAVIVIQPPAEHAAQLVLQRRLGPGHGVIE